MRNRPIRRLWRIDLGGQVVEPTPFFSGEVAIRARRVELAGDLVVPSPRCGLVVFSHGSGSSRFSPRNRQVADALNGAGLGTLLLDLLTAEEHRVDQRTAHLRFDIGLLADRLTDALDWLQGQALTRDLRVGLFGASTGAAAALVAAARRPETVGAVVSRGGRPDLAGDALAGVTAPTLLLVGGEDATVIELNREAAGKLTAEQRLVIVPGAGHLFEEPGKLDEVAGLATDWFRRYLAPRTLHEGT